MQSLVLLTRTPAPSGKPSETASLVYSPYSSTARGQALLLSSLDGSISLFKLADAVVSLQRSLFLTYYRSLHSLVVTKNTMLSERSVVCAVIVARV